MEIRRFAEGVGQGDSIGARCARKRHPWIDEGAGCRLGVAREDRHIFIATVWTLYPTEGEELIIVLRGIVHWGVLAPYEGESCEPYEALQKSIHRGDRINSNHEWHRDHRRARR